MEDKYKKAEIIVQLIACKNSLFLLMTIIVKRAKRVYKFYKGKNATDRGRERYMNVRSKLKSTTLLHQYFHVLQFNCYEYCFV